jgi:hypothetical protein
MYNIDIVMAGDEDSIFWAGNLSSQKPCGNRKRFSLFSSICSSSPLKDKIRFRRIRSKTRRGSINSSVLK